MRFLLDTNICIDLIQRHPLQVLMRLEAMRQGDVVMSVVTYVFKFVWSYPDSRRPLFKTRHILRNIFYPMTLELRA